LNITWLAYSHAGPLPLHIPCSISLDKVCRPRILSPAGALIIFTSSYGTLLGSQVFQSFVGGIVAYRALPRAQFSSLQQAIFPVYFSMQTALPVILALTYPGERTAIAFRPSSLSGVLETQNRLHVLTPLLAMFVTSLANLVAVGPATTRIMKERKHQGDHSFAHLKLLSHCTGQPADILGRNSRWEEKLRGRATQQGNAGFE